MKMILYNIYKKLFGGIIEKRVMGKLEKYIQILYYSPMTRRKYMPDKWSDYKRFIQLAIKNKEGLNIILEDLYFYSQLTENNFIAHHGEGYHIRLRHHALPDKLYYEYEMFEYSIHKNNKSLLEAYLEDKNLL